MERTAALRSGANNGRTQQHLKIEEIGRTLVQCGFVMLDEQAFVLGLSRSTAWTVTRGMHKTSGLSATTINRMLANDHLPLRVRVKLLEYIAAKMAGAYGDQEYRLKVFASKISPAHMPPSAHPDAVDETANVHFLPVQPRVPPPPWSILRTPNHAKTLP